MTLFDSILSYPELIPLLALLVSIISIFIGFLGFLLQRKHNRLSVRPFGVFEMYSGKERLHIFLKNSGIGPMIIKSVEIIDNNGVKKDELMEIICPSNINCLIASFKGLKDHVVSAGESEPLFIYDLDRENTEESKIRDEIQSKLKTLTLRLKYTDIYGIDQPDLNEKLGGFEIPLYPNQGKKG